MVLTLITLARASFLLLVIHKSNGLGQNTGKKNPDVGGFQFFFNHTVAVLEMHEGFNPLLIMCWPYTYTTTKQFPSFSLFSEFIWDPFGWDGERNRKGKIVVIQFLG